MDREIDEQHAATVFDTIRHIDKRGIEYWEARELGEVLGYAQWRNFEAVVEKAKLSITNSGEHVDNHFANVSKMVQVGMTTFNTEAKDLQGQGHIGVEHLKNNDEIRKSLVSRGIKLEELPAEEDIALVERRIRTKKRRTDELKGGA